MCLYRALIDPSPPKTEYHSHLSSKKVLTALANLDSNAIATLRHGIQTQNWQAALTDSTH